MEIRNPTLLTPLPTYPVDGRSGQQGRAPAVAEPTERPPVESVPRNDPRLDYRQSVRAARQGRDSDGDKSSEYREVHQQEVAPYARRALSAYGANDRSEVPDNLVGVDIYV